MRELYLIRHGNAVPEQPLTDHQRALTDSGIAEAIQAAEFLQKHGVVSQTLIHSDALRTTMTAETIAKTLNPHPILLSSAMLYNAPVEKWQEVINELDDQLITVIAVGHNLGISRFATYLHGDFLPEMQTCSIYGFQFDVDSWRDVGMGTGQLILQFSPTV